jgi:hypothetical protein
VLARRERRYRPYQLHDHLTTIYVSTKLETWKKDLLSSPPLHWRALRAALVDIEQS